MATSEGGVIGSDETVTTSTSGDCPAKIRGPQARLAGLTLWHQGGPIGPAVSKDTDCLSASLTVDQTVLQGDLVTGRGTNQVFNGPTVSNEATPTGPEGPGMDTAPGI